MLTTLSFEGEVWSAVLERLRAAFDARVASRYLPERERDGWSIQSIDVEAGSRSRSEAIRRHVAPAIQEQLNGSPFYNPLKPAMPQRNRALLLSDVTTATGRSVASIAEYMSKLRLAHHDQIRVLVCDDSHLLSWLGVLGDQTFDKTDREALQSVVPALANRLRFDQLVHDAAHATATLEATLDAMQVPCFVLHASGRVLEANAAGRSLCDLNPGLKAQLASVPGHPDSSFQLHPVRVRGVPARYVVTLRGRSQSASSRLAERASRWRLTERQTTVLGWLVQGLANKDIASRLNIVLGTVELHVSAILRKARVDSRTALIAAYWDEF